MKAAGEFILSGTCHMAFCVCVFKFKPIKVGWGLCKHWARRESGAVARAMLEDPHVRGHSWERGGKVWVLWIGRGKNADGACPALQHTPYPETYSAEGARGVRGGLCFLRLLYLGRVGGKMTKAPRKALPGGCWTTQNRCPKDGAEPG